MKTRLLITISIVITILTGCNNASTEEPLGTPTNVIAAIGLVGETIDLTWDAVNGAAEYIVYSINGGITTDTEVGRTSETSITLSNITTNYESKFRVKAVNNDVTSNTSEYSGLVKPLPIDCIKVSNMESNSNVFLLVAQKTATGKFDYINLVPGTTDELGYVELRATTDYVTELWCNVWYDNDNSKTLSSGDTTIGPDANNWSLWPFNFKNGEIFLSSHNWTFDYAKSASSRVVVTKN